MSFGKMKKTGVFLAGVLFAGVLLLSGCGGSGSGTPASSAAPAKEKIIVGTEGVVPKWTQHSDSSSDGGVEGFEIDVWKEIAKRNNIDIQWQVADFSGLFGMLDNKEVDTIASQVTDTEERKKKYSFTKPYAFSSYVLVARDDGTPKDKDWFRGKRMAVMAATNMQLALEDMNEKDQMGMELNYLESETLVLTAVQNGTYDGALCIDTDAWIAIKDLNMKLETVNAHYRTLPVLYPFQKTPENDKRIQMIDKTIDDMKKDGTLKRISEKWFGHDISMDTK